MTGNALDPQRWQLLTELFDRALELDAAGREALLAATGDDAVRAELRRMLAADTSGGPLHTANASALRGHAERLLSEDEAGALPIGRRLGVWRIERLLGSGGMGRVFLAVREEGEFEQRVALKLLKSGWVDDLARRRFLEERRVLAKLTHPNIARLYDGGLGSDGEPWYAMEYIDGGPLTDWCDARELPLAARLELFRKVCDAAGFAHRQMVVHRDLKPGNIFVDAQGEPRLLDFGIAKLLSAPDAETRSETRVMTPEYASPEQLRGEPVGVASDVYALGAILFELLTGQRAFRDPLGSRNPPSLLRACRGDDDETQRATARATTPKRLREQLRGDLERIVRCALDPDPARRYRTADALAEDLRRYNAGEPISLRNDRGYRLGKFVRRHRIGVALGAVSALALAFALAFALWQARVARDDAREATRQAHNADAVRDFMVNVFASADPTEHPGKGPRAREMLDAGARAMRRQFGGDPDATAALSRALAKSYAGIGAYDPARALAREALDAAVKLHGVGNAEVLAARADYAEVLQTAGDEQQALQQAQTVLAHASDRVMRVRAYLVAANADGQLLHEAQAEQSARKALALAQMLGASGERWQAVAWNDLAQSYLGRDEFDAAQKALRQAATLYTRSLGADNAQSRDALDNLAFLMLHTGHQDEALALYANLIAEERRSLGPQSPALAATLSQYAPMLWSAGRYAQARTAAEQARVALAAAADMSPLLHADSEHSLAIVAHYRGDLAGALRVLDDIERNDVPRGTFGQRELFATHWLRVAIAAERGESDAFAQLDGLHAQGQKLGYASDFATKLEWPLAWLAAGQPQRALQGYDALSAASSSPRVRATHHNTLLLARGVALVQLGRYPEATQALDQAATAFAGKPEYIAQAITVKLWQGWLQVRAGHPQSGLADIETALRWRQQQLGDESYLTAEARLAHAEALAQLKRHDEALIEQAQARTVLAAQLAPQHALRRRAELPLPH